MSQSPDAVVREWFDQVWNRKDDQAIARLMAPGGLVHGMTGPGGPPLSGPAAFTPTFDLFHGAFSDLHVTIERTVVEGDTCAAFCRVTGRHTGSSLGAPTNRAVDFTGITIARVQDGQLVEGWNVFDFLGMYQQFGWIPAHVAPA